MVSLVGAAAGNSSLVGTDISGSSFDVAGISFVAVDIAVSFAYYLFASTCEATLGAFCT
jgi:hypothetical protein